MQVKSDQDKWLVALDIDGTLVNDEGVLSEEVKFQIQRVRNQGHHVILSTGRSPSKTRPIAQLLGIHNGFAVCSNGALVVKLDDSDQKGYKFELVQDFDPTETLSKLIEVLPEAHFAVEDVTGEYRFHKPFPSHSLANVARESTLSDLGQFPVARLVVLSPTHDTESFIEVVQKLDLSAVSYAIGYTAWLDVTGPGVSKALGLEYCIRQLEIPKDQVIVIGDGRNDLEMFNWAKSNGGLAFAMAQAPEEVCQAASHVTSSVADDGVALVLSGLEGILYSRSSEN